MRTLSRLALPAVAGLLLYGGMAADRPPPAHGSADAGAQLFATSCAACHAADASGGSGPPLTSLRGRYATDADIRAYIAANMPANKPGSLSAEQYTGLAQYLARMNGIPIQAQQTPPPAPKPEPKPEPPPVPKSEPAPTPTPSQTPKPAPPVPEPTPASPAPEQQLNPTTTPSPTEPVPTDPSAAVEKTPTPAPVPSAESPTSNDQSATSEQKQLADPPTVASQVEPTSYSRSWLYGLLALSGVGFLLYIIWKRQKKER